VGLTGEINCQRYFGREPVREHYPDFKEEIKMSNRMYDILKQIALIWLPALGTLYFALAGIWGFPYAEQIVGTITAVDTFLGAVLGLSSHKYKKR
jgi:hypothetical protein